MAAGFRDLLSLIIHWWNSSAIQQPTAPGMEWTLSSMHLHWTLAKNDLDWTLPEED